MVLTFILYVVHALNKLSYSKLDSKVVGVREGVVFLTYSSLIASSVNGSSRLKQPPVQWCGKDYGGLIVFDEVMLLRMGNYAVVSQGQKFST